MFVWLVRTLQRTRFTSCFFFDVCSSIFFFFFVLLPVGCVFCYRLPTHMSVVARVSFIVMMHIHMKTILSIYIRIMIYQCDGTTKALTNSIHALHFDFANPSSFAATQFCYGMCQWNFIVYVYLKLRLIACVKLNFSVYLSYWYSLCVSINSGLSSYFFLSHSISKASKSFATSKSYKNVESVI